MKRFYFRSFSYYIMQVLGIGTVALLIWMLALTIIQGEIAMAVFAAVITVALIAALIWSFFVGRVIVTKDDVRVYAPAYMPKRFASDKIRVIIIQFKKHKKRMWYEASVEVRLLNSKKFRFSFYHTTPRGGSFGKISPKRKANLEAIAEGCEKVTCETVE